MSVHIERRLVPAPVHCGQSVISGVVRELTIPVRGRQVLLLERETMRVIRETRSGSNGAYSFQSLSVGLDCVLLSFDPNGAYNAVVADRVQT